MIAPDVGGGFGVKIVHPWPEEILIPWAAINPSAGRSSGSRTGASTSSPRAHGGVSCRTLTVGFDDEGHLLGLDVEFWHDNGAYTPVGIIVPIVTSTQLLGPYKPGAYRVEFRSMYTNTTIVTPYRGAGRPQGVVRDGTHHGRHRGRTRNRPGGGAAQGTSSRSKTCPTTTS